MNPAELHTEQATLAAVHPVLPVRDVTASLVYYVDRLGFTRAFQDTSEDPHYAGVRRGAVELHLQWHDAAEWEAVERPSLRFYVPAVEILFEAYQAQDVFHPQTQLRDTPWGTREFGFFDPDGNGLIFYRDLTVAERAAG